jgi:hypothetical protein
MLSFPNVVIAFAFLQAQAPQPFDLQADRAAFEVYASVLRDKEPDATEPLLLQAETEAPRTCTDLLARMTGEWSEVADNFRRENARVRVLRAGLPLGVEYRVIPRADILADDARIAAKDPRRTNAPRPRSIEYIALSAVGFNAARTKALVYARYRTKHFSDALLMRELKEGKWVAGPMGCSGVA